jgi:tetratricopeptide (TPR) repeat protein
MPAMGQENTDSYWNDNGVNLSKAGQYDAALAAFDKAIEIDPGFAAEWYNKGIALLALGRFAESKDAITRAMNLGYTALPPMNGSTQQLFNASIRKLETTSQTILKQLSWPLRSEHGRGSSQHILHKKYVLIQELYLASISLLLMIN